MKKYTENGIANGDSKHEKSELSEEEREKSKAEWKTKRSGSLPPCPVFLVGLITFSQIFAVGMLLFVISQYGYVRFSETLFPNATIIQSGESRCLENASDTDAKIEKTVQKATAKWSVYNILANGIPVLIIAPIMACMSDKHGRKYMLLPPLIGAFIKSLLLTLTIHFEWNVNLIPVWNAVEAFSGSWLVSVALGCSYAADMTSSDKDRSIAIAVVELFIGFGFLLATFTSGYIIKSFGFIVPPIIAMCITLLCSLVLIFLMPESLPKDRRVLGVNPFQRIKASVDFYIKKDIPGAGERWKYLVCIGVFCCVSMGTLSRTNIELLYQLGSPFCWTSVQISVWGTYRTALQQVIGFCCLP